MAATIRRGSGPARRPVARRKPVKVPLGDRILARMPISHETLRKLATGAILCVGGAAVVAVASWAGVPAMLGAAVADAAGRAGFRVEQIEVTGLKRMDFMTVNAVALDQRSLAMPAVDLAAVRNRLLDYGWVADAHVSRRLPDTLLIHIDERTPAAVWQSEGHLTLIDANGVLLEPVDPAKMPDLPLVIGPGAYRQELAYQALLSHAPALKPRVKAATWVGNRRWDLTFDTGEVLKLPEEGAAAALVRFAERDGAHPLLGHGFLSFDLRDPSKLVARKPGQGTQALADPGAGAANAAVPARGMRADEV